MAKFKLRACAFCGGAFKGPFIEFSPSSYCKECSGERRRVARLAFASVTTGIAAGGDYVAPIELLIRAEECS